MSDRVRVRLDEPLSTWSAGTPRRVDGEAGRHLAQVVRLRAGETLLCDDGLGFEAPARVTEVDARKARVWIERTGPEVPGVGAAEPAILLCQALARGDRFDQAVRDAVQLGVHAILPVRSARTHPDAAKDPSRRTRWDALVRSACAQCGRADTVRVATPEDVTAALASAVAWAAGGPVVWLSEHGGRPLSDWLSSTGRPARAAVFVGPEGGWTDAELSAARSKGVWEASLGPRILRTETAGVAALAAMTLGPWVAQGTDGPSTRARADHGT